MIAEETELKKKELERLLKDGIINVNEYLEAVAKLEKLAALAM